MKVAIKLNNTGINAAVTFFHQNKPIRHNTQITKYF